MYTAIKDFIDLELYYTVKRVFHKYYIIRRGAGGAGFFSNYLWVLGHVAFARRLGYIPVVDMKNYSSLYKEDMPVNGEENAWNYYFEDCGETLEHAYQSKRYVMAPDKYLTKYTDKYCGMYHYPTKKAIAHYGDIIENNIRIRADIEEEFHDLWIKQVSDTDHVLGIHVRGTDMKNNLGHPMPASVATYLKCAHELLDRYPEINKVFLATDETNVQEAFEKEFANTKWILFMNEGFRVCDDGRKVKTGVHETVVENPRLYHKYLMGKEVLRDAWFLNKSEYLICGHSNVTNVVLLWNQNRFKQVICLETDKGQVSKRK